MTDNPFQRYRTRHLDLMPLEAFSCPITIVGAGAIGSYTTLALAKLGFCNLEVWDDDVVDDVNVGVQLYGPRDIGQHKVNALARIIEEQTAVELKCHRTKAQRDVNGRIIIMAVDSMVARKTLWENNRPELFIDARMAIEFALLFAMKPGDKQDAKAYRASLYTDESAVQERCTLKATTYTAMLIGGMVAKTVKDYLASKGERYPRTMQWDIAQGAQIIGWGPAKPRPIEVMG